MNKKSDSLLFKFAIIFVIFTVIALVMSGISTYVNQMNSYKRESEDRIRQIADYLETLMASDGKEFIHYQEYYMEHFDELDIPVDFTAKDYEAAKAKFDALFSKEFPGKELGKDVTFDELSDEAKKAYTIYQHEYWLLTYEEARESFGVIYTYYLYPAEGDHNMTYMIDVVREPQEENPEYINLGITVDQDPAEHETMWEAWDTGKEPNGYDYYDNEFGETYAYYSPLIVNGVKMGVIGVEIEVARVNQAVLANTLRQVLWIGIILTVSVAILLWYIHRQYIAKLERLQSSVNAYASTKDMSVATTIENDAAGSDEISSLSMQIAAMILELENYMKSLIATTNELTTTKDKMDQLNELAHKDALTGIRNKTAYDKELDRIEWAMEDKPDSVAFAIAMIDLNFLKRINDTYGHERGNYAIKELCRMVCNQFKHSPVFRIGGDEFVVILENDDYKNADQLVAEFNETLDKLAADNSLEPWERVSAAVGIAKYNPKKDSSATNVFKRADKAMYARKKAMKAVRVN